MFRKLTLVSLAVSLGVLTAVASAGTAQAGKNILPGVKGYTFKAAPLKLNRLCTVRWNGHFWQRPDVYGCDKIIRGGQELRVDCQMNSFDCFATTVDDAAIGGVNGAPAAGRPGGGGQKR